MQRTKLRELLVSGGIENPSGDLLGAILDAFNEEKETLKTDYETKIAEANKKVEDAESKVKAATENQIKKDDYDKLVQENEENKAKLQKINRQAVLSKYKIDKDFYDAVISKIESGKDDAEFDANVKAFAEKEENKKYLVGKEIIIDSNPNPKGKTPEPPVDEFHKAISEHYSNNNK